MWQKSVKKLATYTRVYTVKYFLIKDIQIYLIFLNLLKMFLSCRHFCMVPINQVSRYPVRQITRHFGGVHKRRLLVGGKGVEECVTECDSDRILLPQCIFLRYPMIPKVSGKKSLISNTDFSKLENNFLKIYLLKTVISN